MTPVRLETRPKDRLDARCAAYRPAPRCSARPQLCWCQKAPAELHYDWTKNGGQVTPPLAHGNFPLRFTPEPDSDPVHQWLKLVV